MKAIDQYISMLRFFSGEKCSKADHENLQGLDLQIEQTDALMINKPKRLDYVELKKRLKQFFIGKTTQTTPLPGEMKMDNNYHSVVLVVSRKKLKDNENGTYSLSSKLLRNRKIRLNSSETQFKLCPDIDFGDQDSAPSKGTGFFVRPNVILTAAHVLVPYKNLKEEVAFITNFNPESIVKQDNKLIIPQKDVFFPKHSKLDPRYYDYTESGADWALVSVDRHNEYYVTIDPNPVVNNQEIYCIGHGLGLPKKVSYWGQIIRTRLKKAFFESQMSVISGNSGSPVFDALSHATIGVLVRGTAVPILNPDKECVTISKPSSEEEGDECQKMTTIYDALNVLDTEMNNQNNNNMDPMRNPTTPVEANNAVFPAFRINTPYVYATQRVEAGHFLIDLFVLIPVENGKKIVFPATGELHPSSLDFNCQLITGTAEDIITVNGQNFAKKHYNFELNTTNVPDPESFELIVKVRSSEAVLHKIGLILADLDKQEINLDIEQELALDCPYVYLTRLSEGANKFYPRLLIPTKRSKSPLAEQLLVTSGRIGICETVVLPHGDADQPIDIYMPSATNDTYFVDQGIVDGSYTVIVKNVSNIQVVEEFASKNPIERRAFLNDNLAAVEPNPKKEVVIRPGSADTMPNNLI